MCCNALRCDASQCRFKISEDTRPNDVLMLVQRRGRLPNINPTVGQRIVLAGTLSGSIVPISDLPVTHEYSLVCHFLRP